MQENPQWVFREIPDIHTFVIGTTGNTGGAGNYSRGTVNNPCATAQTAIRARELKPSLLRMCCT